MNFQGALRDGQTQTDAAAFSVAPRRHAVKRAKNILQLLVGDSRPEVAHAENRERSFFARDTTQSDFDARVLARVAHGVTNHVFKGAVQKRFDATHFARLIFQQLDIARTAARFILRIGDDVGDHVIEGNPRSMTGKRRILQQIFQPRQFQKLADEIVQTAAFATNALEGR